MIDQPEDPRLERAEAAHTVARIQTDRAVVTYVQVWELGSREAQNRWLEVMHDSVHILQAKKGFVSMTLHSSLDGTRIAVYAQWTSRETLHAAISDPEAEAAHDRMAEIGTSDGSLYIVERVYGPVG
jgi:quinol monooxygenase YgiN